MAQTLRYVPFKVWRIFLFGMQNAWKIGTADTEAEKAVRRELADLVTECLRAIDDDKQDLMVAKLDILLKEPSNKSILDDLLARHDITESDISRRPGK